MIATRVAVLLERYQPRRALISIEASAGLPVASLTGWVDQTASARPAAPVSVDTIRRVAAAIGAPQSVVSRAFTGTWYDFNGWEWSHFQPRDRVIVFDAPDAGTRARRVWRGTVTAVDPLGTIDVLLDDGAEHCWNPDTEGQISHLTGGCRCSTPLYP
ncbi:MAG TPA: hypothetical protein VJT72_11170 [Pseudonocardiaceae bacterium]|nr:hypothetical protein [Pseudonocardiaceae bacterium]